MWLATVGRYKLNADYKHPCQSLNILEHFQPLRRVFMSVANGLGDGHREQVDLVAGLTAEVYIASPADYGIYTRSICCIVIQ